MTRSSARTSMKALLSIAAGLMLLNLSSIPLSFGQSTQLQVIAPTTPILVSTQFDVDINVINVTNLFAWQIKLYYNPAVLKWINATYPPGHVFDGKPIATAPPFNGSDVNGTYILFTASLQGAQPGFNGTGALCRIIFEAKATGSSTLIFSRPLGAAGDTWLTTIDLNFDIPFTVIERDALNPVTTTPDATPPITYNNYDGLWHASDFTINLTATDNLSGVAETYYKVNGGANKTVRVDGQPRITAENTNNTLEYWSVDNLGNEEVPHNVLKEIKLDKTAPTGSFTINNGATYTNRTTAALRLSATDATSGVAETRMSNDNITYTDWQLYAQFKSWSLQSVDGTRTVYLQFRDNAGLVSQYYFQTIILDTTPPVISVISPPNNSGARSSTVTVAWEGLDGVSGIDYYELRLDGGSWTNVGTNTDHVFTGIGNGAHIVQIKAVNKAATERVVSVNFNVDTSLFLGLGLLEVISIVAVIILVILGIGLYLFKFRKQSLKGEGKL